MGTVDRDAPLCVGRDAELEQMREALEVALAGRGRLVLLSGDPGIGKTRLAETVAADASARGAGVVWGRCWEAGGAPAYWPWIEALRALVAERGAQSLATAAPGAARDAARLVPELGASNGHDEEPDAARFALFDGVAELLIANARAAPLVLVLEDLHAADATSLLLLDLLAQRLPGAPMLVLATHRIRDPGTDPQVEELLARLVRRGEPLILSGLDVEATRALAAASSGSRLPDDSVAALRRRTGGNPFFIQSLARVIGDAGELPSPVPLPAGVRETIARRLAPLSEGTRTALASAAVLGRDFSLARLARLRSVEQADALGLVEPALRAGLVVEGASPGELRFAHELIRDWLYGELDPSERAELHRGEADSLEALAGRDPRLLNELAHHRVAAAPVGGTGAAIDACERAARHAVDELAFEDAAALYERGLALAERLLEALEPARHAGLLIALGETRQRAGDSDGAREAFARAANLARASGLPAELAQAALGFGAIVVKPGETDQTLVALLEQSLALVPESSAALRSQLLARLARELHFKADTERPRALAVEAVALAERSGEPAVQAFALHAWHVAHAAPDTAEARAEVSAEIVELARESGDTELELSGWVLAATDMLELGRPGAAAERLDEAEVLAARLRQPALTWRVLLVRGTLASLAGRFDEAERTIAEAYSVGRRAVGRGAFRYWVLQRHELMYLRGGDERLEADERLLAEEAPDVWGAGLLHLLAIRGRGDEARAGFEQLAANDFGGPIDDMAALPVLSRCAEICALLGDTERAELIYERLLPHADRWLGVLGSVFAGTVHARLGGLAATMGHNERAAEHLEAAVEAHREAGAAPITALAEADLAGVLRTLGDSRRADELRGHALLTARALGMKPLVERLEAEPPPVAPAPRAGARLELEGEYWLIDYAATQVRVRDRKGIGYLARLLERPHVEIPALELASGQATPPAGDAGAMLDDEAKRAYRRRLDELRAEIEEAESWNDPERAERASGELEFLTGELARAVGLGGRDRRAASSAERARVSVTRAIRSAIEAIEEQHPELGGHLSASVRTGAYCRYAPAAGQEVSWRGLGAHTQP